MRLSSGIGILLVLCPILACAPRAIAGPLAPCVKAVSSSNGNFLVITEIQLEPGKEIVAGQPMPIQQVSLRVFPRERFINEKDRLVAPATFWTDLTWEQWSVVFDLRKTPHISSCPLSLITDDGEFLVIVNGGFQGSLRIYRRQDHRGSPAGEGPDHGVFIRDVPLKELWPPGRLAALHFSTQTDHSLQWFAGGTFEFSTDCRQLIHKTRWGNTVRIHLADGVVSSE
jgi:hypothetical protein